MLIHKIGKRHGLLWGLCAAAVIGFALPAAAADLTITGSGNPEYVLGRLAAAFNAAQTLHRVTIPPSSGTAGALRDVEAGTTSMGRVGRPLKDSERSKGLVYVPLGRDLVAFAGGAGVTARNISVQQVLDVYSGKITDWRDLGGKPAPVRAVGREVTDASRVAVSRVIPGFEKLVFADSVKLVHLDPQLIELVDRYPSSLCFLNLSALKAAKSPVVPLALDGVAPTLENLTAGRYPLWLEFGLVHRTGGADAAGQAFIVFIRSAAGAAILREHGVMPWNAG